MMRQLIYLLRHRVTWRFLCVLAAAIGLTSGTEHIGELEALLGALLTCVP